MDGQTTVNEKTDCEGQEEVTNEENVHNQHQVDADKELESPELIAYPKQLTSLKAAEFTDPTTQAVIKTRQDLLLSVLYPSGERILEHDDGTRVTIGQEGWKVESNELPTVIRDASGVSTTPSPGAAPPYPCSYLQIRQEYNTCV